MSKIMINNNLNYHRDISKDIHYINEFNDIRTAFAYYAFLKDIVLQNGKSNSHGGAMIRSKER